MYTETMLLKRFAVFETPIEEVVGFLFLWMRPSWITLLEKQGKDIKTSEL